MNIIWFSPLIYLLRIKYRLFEKKYLYQDVRYRMDKIIQKQSAAVRAAQKIKDPESLETSCRWRLNVQI